jgi:hypothetical protein
MQAVALVANGGGTYTPSNGYSHRRSSDYNNGGGGSGSGVAGGGGGRGVGNGPSTPAINISEYSSGSIGSQRCSISLSESSSIGSTGDGDRDNQMEVWDGEQDDDGNCGYSDNPMVREWLPEHQESYELVNPEDDPILTPRDFGSVSFRAPSPGGVERRVHGGGNGGGGGGTGGGGNGGVAKPTRSPKVSHRKTKRVDMYSMARKLMLSHIAPQKYAKLWNRKANVRPDDQSRPPARGSSCD